MLDDAADEIQAHVGEPGITVTSKERCFAFPDRQMGVHTRTVIFLDWLGHKRCCLAICMCHLMHDIFVNLHAVSGFCQRAKGQTKLMLSRGNLMVVLVARQTHFQHGRNHLATDIHRAINRCYGEVAALGTWAMPHVAAFIFRTAVGGQFDIVNLVIGCAVAIFETHIVKHEEFSLWAYIDRITNASCFQIGFRTLGGRTWVAAVQFASRWLYDVAENDHHRRCGERINVHRFKIWL